MSIQWTDSVDLLTGTVNADASVGVTTTTTGKAFDVSKRQQILVQFVRTNHTSGNGVYSIDGSNDAVHWTTSLACQDTQSTTPTTFVTTITLSSNTQKAVIVPQGWRFIRGVVTLTTDGTAFSLMEAGG